jgi:hypothetical protein
MNPFKLEALVDGVISNLIEALNHDIFAGQNANGERVLHAKMHKLNLH